MQPLRNFHEYILPDVPGCPINVLNSVLRSTIIDFCEKSLLWKHESEPTTIRAGYARYTFSPTEDARVVEPVFVSINDIPLTAVSLSQLDEQYPGWRESISTRPTLYYMDTATSIKLIGTPSEDLDSALEVHVALKPKRNTTSVPDFIYEDWADIIAHGALARLHAMANRTWAEPTLVSYHYRKYRSGLSRARMKAIKSRQKLVTIGVQPRKFGDIFNG